MAPSDADRLSVGMRVLTQQQLSILGASHFAGGQPQYCEWEESARSSQTRRSSDDLGAAGGVAGLKCPPPSPTTAPDLPLWLLWRLRVGLSNPTPRLISSEAEEASWKVAARSAENEP